MLCGKLILFSPKNLRLVLQLIPAGDNSDVFNIYYQLAVKLAFLVCSGEVSHTEISNRIGHKSKAVHYDYSLNWATDQ